MNSKIDLSMITPFSLNFFFQRKKRLFFTIFLLNIFLVLFSLDASDLSEKQHDEIKMFLENLMIRDGGLYTLLGSKPITEFDIIQKTDETEEGMLKSYDNLKNHIEKQKLNPNKQSQKPLVLPSFEEFKQKCLLYRDDFKFRDFKDLWELWLNTYGAISNPIYKLIPWEGHYKTGLFINVPSLAFTLKKYYKEFSQITGMEFDIDVVLNSIEEEGSVFWQKVFKDHFLHGLILGYGEKNAYLFNWAMNAIQPPKEIAISRFPELSRQTQYIKTVLKRKVTVSDLPIPFFQSFGIEDEEVERYTKEREKIITFMENKELVHFVLMCFDSKEKARAES